MDPRQLLSESWVEGRGLVARPRSDSPPPARLVWATASALSGRALPRALTRMTSSGVSRKVRSMASGSTKRTVSSTACTATEMPRASCRVLRLRSFTEKDYLPKHSRAR